MDQEEVETEAIRLISVYCHQSGYEFPAANRKKKKNVFTTSLYDVVIVV
jgi:hypothetical protein